MAGDPQKDVQKRERTTIDEARKEGIGEPGEGTEPSVPSYTDSGGISDLGIAEPVVPRKLRGASSPEPGVAEDNDKNEDT